VWCREDAGGRGWFSGLLSIFLWKGGQEGGEGCLSLAGHQATPGWGVRRQLRPLSKKSGERGTPTVGRLFGVDYRGRGGGGGPGRGEWGGGRHREGSSGYGE